MTREVQEDPNLSTAEIANPSTRYRADRSRTTELEVVDNARNADSRNAEGALVPVAEPTHTDDRPTQLFPDNELNDFRARWDKAQIGFVDEPRSAVEQADSLVATVVKRIAEQFAAERAELEHQWDRGDNVSTEDLRQALRRYRSFFDRLLAF
jgi:hypothetical protein